MTLDWRLLENDTALEEKLLFELSNSNRTLEERIMKNNQENIKSNRTNNAVESKMNDKLSEIDLRVTVFSRTK